MCGIVGLYCKTPEMEQRLGDHLSSMLIEMTDRGPDSAGVAFYRDPAPKGHIKVTLYAAEEGFDWAALAGDLGDHLGGSVKVSRHGSHAVLLAPGGFDRIEAWLGECHPELRLVSAGDTIEIFKDTGLPQQVVDAFELRQLTGTHALGHTRMATESAVTTAGSHPFSTGMDLCLVHNGSLSNHNRLRRFLRKQDIEIKTENDTEVAAGYLTWRLREGDSLEEALQAGLKDFDGFYTFAVGTREGFAVLRDPIACKHAVMAETDDWVAMATEFRAIAKLPGSDEARIWEPAPSQIYSWSRS
jgi:glutamate synthase domain-containing protein 1